MSDELIVKVKGEPDLPLDVDAALADLTGDETVMLEEYLGGWQNFDITKGSARSVIAVIWLARRQAGQKSTLGEIGQIKGLLFGDAFDIEGGEEGPPAGAATAATPSTLETSDTSGHGLSRSVTA